MTKHCKDCGVSMAYALPGEAVCVNCRHKTLGLGARLLRRVKILWWMLDLKWPLWLRPRINDAKYRDSESKDWYQDRW